MHATLTADPKPAVDPTDPDLARSLAAALAWLGLIDLAAGVVSCTDSGEPNGGDGGGRLVLVTTAHPHGLDPGDHVVLSGTGYDGDREAEPRGDSAFLILNTAFAAPTAGGTWKRA